MSTAAAHDLAGNTSAAPRVNSWVNGNLFYYDAWNRVVHVKGGGTTLAKFSYDGRNYRIRKEVYDSMGVLSFTDHTYYNDGWQALEVRRETAGTEDPDPREQFVWHPEYIDSLAVRYYDSDTDANLAELSDGTHYYTHDANYNVTAITTATGTVLERYQYDPYGKLTVLDANFANDADGKSDIDNATTYTGRWFDPESGRYDFRNREYDPITGRFLGRDPIGYEDGENLYAAYFGPNANDPLGTKTICGTAGGFLGWIFGVSGSASVCKDDCGSVAVVACAGGGLVFGGSGGISITGADGCLSSGLSGQGVLQGGIGPGGGSITFDGSGVTGVGAGLGIGPGGVALTGEGCLTIMIKKGKPPPKPIKPPRTCRTPRGPCSSTNACYNPGL